MKKQNQKVLQIILALAVLGAGVFYLSTVPTGNDARKAPEPIDTELVKSINPDYEEISVKKGYFNGEHVISGVLILPTPCHKIIPEIIIMESYPEQVEVNLLVVDEGGACAQVLTETVFEARFKASELATVRGLLHNEPIEFIEE